MNNFPGQGLGMGYSILSALGYRFNTYADVAVQKMLVPAQKDLTIWRGASFIVEYTAQNKVYAYDPSVHTTLADRKRTHEENLVHYGHAFEYVNFFKYTSAELIVIKPWVRDGQVSEPILSLTAAAGDIILTSTKIVVTLPPADTEAILFDSGIYKLLLTMATGQVDLLAYGSVTVRGDK